MFGDQKYYFLIDVSTKDRLVIKKKIHPLGQLRFRFHSFFVFFKISKDQQYLF